MEKEVEDVIEAAREHIRSLGPTTLHPKRYEALSAALAALDRSLAKPGEGDARPFTYEQYEALSKMIREHTTDEPGVRAIVGEMLGKWEARVREIAREEAKRQADNAEVQSIEFATELVKLHERQEHKSRGLGVGEKDVPTWDQVRAASTPEESLDLRLQRIEHRFSQDAMKRLLDGSIERKLGDHATLLEVQATQIQFMHPKTVDRIRQLVREELRGLGGKSGAERTYGPLPKGEFNL